MEPAIAVAGEQRSRRVVLEDALGGDREERLDHRRLDHAALARRVAPREAEERSVGGMEARERIRTGARRQWSGLLSGGGGIGSQPGDPADLLHRLREADAIAPGSVEAKGGHAHEHDPRVRRGELRVVEAEVVEHAGREVLDHDVGLLRELEQER
jgi:hypothetical protein